jgi:putative flippase GtrA
MTNDELTMRDKVVTLVSEHRSEVKRFGKFMVVGGIGAIIDFGVLNLLIGVVGWDKYLSNVISVSCAIISNFWWNRHWTFPESREHDLHKSFGKFAAVNLVGLGINQIVFFLADFFIFDPMFDHPLDYNLAKLTAVGVVLFWNFFANRLWTYRDI